MNRLNGKLRKLFLDSSWLFGGKTLAGIFAALEAIVLARMLGVDKYGLLALVVAYVEILNNLFDFRVWETATKYIGTFWENGEEEKALSVIKLSYLINLFSGILAVSITIITSQLAEKYLIHSAEANWYVCIYAFSMIINTANTTSDAILRIFDKFKTIATISTSYNFLKLSVVIIILYLGMGIQEVLFSYVFVSIIGFVIRMWLVSKCLKENSTYKWWNANLRQIKDKWKDFAWFVSNTSLAGTLKIANDDYIGILLLGHWSGKEAVAYYKVAKSFAKLLVRISDPLYEAIYPELVRFTNFNNFQALKDLIKNSTKNLMIISIPITLLFIIFAYPILNLIYGNTYIEAVNALRIISLAGVISMSIFWISPVILAIGRPGLRNILDIITTVSFIVMLFLLVPRYSYTGAAFAFLSSVLVKLLASIYIYNISLESRIKTYNLDSCLNLYEPGKDND